MTYKIENNVIMVCSKNGIKIKLLNNINIQDYIWNKGKINICDKYFNINYIQIDNRLLISPINNYNTYEFEDLFMFNSSNDFCLDRIVEILS